MTDKVADALFRVRACGETGGVDSLPIRDLDHALDVQLQVADRFMTAGDSLAGYKIGWTSGRARAVAERHGVHPFGYLLKSGTHSSGTSLPLAPIRRCRIEPEICLTLGRDLGGPAVSVDEARTAVVAAAPAFEINEFRLDSEDPPLAVADDLHNWGIVVGADRPVSRVDLMTTQVDLFRDGITLGSRSVQGYLDDPYVSLTHLTATLARFGRGLTAGQRVITGSLLQSQVTEPAAWHAVFSTLGEVRLNFVAAG